MTSINSSEKIILGRSVLLDFVDQGLLDVPAKTDTGAYRSSVHASNIKENSDGSLSFNLLVGHPAVSTKIDRITVSKYSKVRVTNSFGHTEQRFEIKLHVKLGDKVLLASFSLSNRAKNVYPVLLGRRLLLNGHYLVDVAKTGINRARLKKQGIDFPVDEEEGR